MRYAIRPMELEDIRQVMEIERESFPTLSPATAYKRELLHNRMACYFVAWEKGSELPPPVATEVRQDGSRLDRLLSGVKHFFSGEEEAKQSSQQIAGFAGLWFMVGEGHLTTIAVRQAYRRQGIGELLLISAVELALQRNAQYVVLEVRASNLAAQALYEKYGFNKVRVRRGYYTDNKEDALVMVTNSIASASFQSNFQRLKQAHSQKWGATEVITERG